MSELFCSEKQDMRHQLILIYFYADSWDMCDSACFEQCRILNIVNQLCVVVSYMSDIKVHLRQPPLYVCTMFCSSEDCWLLACDSTVAVQCMCAQGRVCGFVWGEKKKRLMRSKDCVCLCLCVSVWVCRCTCTHGCISLSLLEYVCSFVDRDLEIGPSVPGTRVPPSSLLMIFTWGQPVLVTVTFQLTVMWRRAISHKYASWLWSWPVLVMALMVGDHALASVCVCVCARVWVSPASAHEALDELINLWQSVNALRVGEAVALNYHLWHK